MDSGNTVENLYQAFVLQIKKTTYLLSNQKAGTGLQIQTEWYPQYCFQLEKEKSSAFRFVRPLLENYMREWMTQTARHSGNRNQDKTKERLTLFSHRRQKN